jgi:1-acyl-sn-glycerol-3-phosphate acyltransferase
LITNYYIYGWSGAECLLNYNQIKQLAYALFLTNRYGFRLRKFPDPMDKKRLRLEYSQKLLRRLNISVRVENADKLPKEGQYLLFSNHRSIIDPLVIDIALKDTGIFGLWVAKKELYNSLFFGMAIRHGGCVRVDRERHQPSRFFSDIKQGLSEGSSIFIFPEGTRNKGSEALLPFKDGLRIIAIKNRLPMLPVYIQTHTGEVLGRALKEKGIQQEVVIVIGDMISHKEKRDPEAIYREMFGLDR